MPYDVTYYILVVILRIRSLNELTLQMVTSILLELESYDKDAKLTSKRILAANNKSKSHFYNHNSKRHLHDHKKNAKYMYYSKKIYYERD